MRQLLILLKYCVEDYSDNNNFKKNNKTMEKIIERIQIYKIILVVLFFFNIYLLLFFLNDFYRWHYYPLEGNIFEWIYWTFLLLIINIIFLIISLILFIKRSVKKLQLFYKILVIFLILTSSVFSYIFYLMSKEL